MILFLNFSFKKTSYNYDVIYAYILLSFLLPIWDIMGLLDAHSTIIIYIELKFYKFKYLGNDLTWCEGVNE